MARADQGTLRGEPCDTRAMLALALSLLALSMAVPQPPTAVFVGGEGGYPVYRIPSITRIEGSPSMLSLRTLLSTVRRLIVPAGVSGDCFTDLDLVWAAL